MEFVPHKITLHPCEDMGGREVIITNIDGEEEPDHEWFTTKKQAIASSRDVFNAEPTIKKLVILNKEHWEENENGRLVLSNDETVIRKRN
mgnify:CR=1 FL=1